MSRGAAMDAKDLRTEIIESQKFKVDLLKWKLLLAAGLGGAGLGGAGLGAAAQTAARAGDQAAAQAGSGMPLLLALIPLVCAFVDVVCYHNDLRIMVIARFLRTDPHAGSFARAYERLCLKHRRFFVLEGFALYWATLALSVLVAAGPWLMIWAEQDPGKWTAVSIPLTLAGCVGLMASAAIRFHVNTSVDALDDEEGRKVPAWSSGGFVLVTVLVTGAVGVGLWRYGGQRLAAGILALVALVPVALVAHRIRALRKAVGVEGGAGGEAPSVSGE